MTVAPPRVRVVVLNYEGGELTIECLRSVLATDWPHGALELVLVDNASHDGIATRVADEFPDVRVVRAPRNLGFAGGNNLALRDLRDVDHVALINNDVVVTPGWLTPLAATMATDSSIGAVCPKILFRSRYLEGTLPAGVRVSGVRVDGLDVGARTLAVSGFLGPRRDPGTGLTERTTVAEATLRVPVDAGSSAPHRGEVRLANEGTEPQWRDLQLVGPPFDLVNNAGNILVDNQYGADRGYCERDDDSFDQPADVFAWSGAAVLLRREYLEDVGLFDERLFLYYEDFELSWRGSTRGWRYRYEPRSVVRHVHAASSVAHSPISEYYNSRNRLLVLTRHAPWGAITRAFGGAFGALGGVRLGGITPLLPAVGDRSERLRRRARALFGYLRLAPSMVVARRQDRRGDRSRRRDGTSRFNTF